MPVRPVDEEEEEEEEEERPAGRVVARSRPSRVVVLGTDLTEALNPASTARRLVESAARGARISSATARAFLWLAISWVFLGLYWWVCWYIGGARAYVYTIADVALIPAHIALVGVVLMFALLVFSNILGVFQRPLAAIGARGLSVRAVLGEMMYLGLAYYFAPLTLVPIITYASLVFYQLFGMAAIYFIGMLPGVVATVSAVGGIISIIILAVLLLLVLPLIYGLIMGLLVGVPLSVAVHEMLQAVNLRAIMVGFLLWLVFRAPFLLGPVAPAATYIGLIALSVYTVYAGIAAAMGKWRDLNRLPALALVYAMARGMVPVLSLSTYINAVADWYASIWTFDGFTPPGVLVSKLVWGWLASLLA